MGFFTAFENCFYDRGTRAPLDPAPGFSLDAAETLAWAAQLAYEVDDQAKVDGVLQRWRWTGFKNLSKFRSGLVPFRVVGAYVATFDSATIVSFSGTEPERIEDWFTDLSAILDASVHTGFMKAVDAIADDLAQILDARTGPMWFTGHSLGAAIAALAAWRMSETPARAKRIRGVYGFGMPRIGDATFAQDYAARRIADGATLGAQTFRLVHGDDVVTRLPPPQLRYTHVGHALLTTHGRRFDAAALHPATIEDAPMPPLPSPAALLPEMPGSLPAFPGARTAAKIAVATQIRAVRDHLMDRYLLALGATD